MPLMLHRLPCTLTSFCGVLLVSLSDSDESAQQTGRPLVGDFLALLSAFCYAVYVTLLKVWIRSESRIDMQLFFGFVGVFNLLGCWPIGVLLHFSEMEKFEWPTKRDDTAVILLNVSLPSAAISGAFVSLSSDGPGAI